MIFFTADTHFGHDNILKFKHNRAQMFDDSVGMDEYIVHMWNRMVGKNDTVYHLGDFGCRRQDHVISITRRLNGKKILVPGNHDAKLIKNPKFTREFEYVAPGPYLEKSIGGERVVMCHYPIWEWNQAFRGSIHLHGHVHAIPTGIPGKIMDVGVDTNNMLCYTWEQIKTYMKDRPYRT